MSYGVPDHFVAAALADFDGIRASSERWSSTWERCEKVRGDLRMSREDTLALLLDDLEATRAMDIAIRFVGSDKRFMALVGSVGTGKTVAAIWAALARAYAPEVVTAQEIAKATGFKGDAKLDRWISTRALVIDEMGTEDLPRGGAERMADLLSTRMRDRTKTTCVTSNLSTIAWLSRYDPTLDELSEDEIRAIIAGQSDRPLGRLGDRIRGQGVMLKVDGPSLRHGSAAITFGDTNRKRLEMLAKIVSRLDEIQIESRMGEGNFALELAEAEAAIVGSDPDRVARWERFRDDRFEQSRRLWARLDEIKANGWRPKMWPPPEEDEVTRRNKLSAQVEELREQDA